MATASKKIASGWLFGYITDEDPEEKPDKIMRVCGSAVSGIVSMCQK